MHQRRTVLLVAGLAAGAATACAGTGRAPISQTCCTAVPTGARLIPTRYSADRFFATAILARGDTASLFLDTGSGSYVWDAYLPYLELRPDTMLNASGAKVAVAAFPRFRAEHSLPPAVTATPLGTRLTIRAVNWAAPNNFAAWIGRTTQGQLGTNWFGDRVWTFDYPRRRLLLHESPVPRPAGARELPLYFQTDTAGRRVSHGASFDVVLGGDTLAMLFDTGATIWLTADALARVADGGPSERATCHIPRWLFARWRARHPDWSVIENADLWAGLPLIRVPSASIAGYELGPMWVSALPGDTTRPSVPATAPAWQRRRGGTVGGSALRSFLITVDYPRAVAWFVRPDS